MYCKARDCQEGIGKSTNFHGVGAIGPRRRFAKMANGRLQPCQTVANDSASSAEVTPHNPSDGAREAAARQRLDPHDPGAPQKHRAACYHRPVSVDARLHARFAVDARADVIGEEVVLARPVADISQGGCRFGMTAWEAAGTSVQLVLSFPTVGANVPLSGRVVRATAQDMGVRFENLSDEQKWALRKHIRDVQRDHK